MGVSPSSCAPSALSALLSLVLHCAAQQLLLGNSQSYCYSSMIARAPVHPVSDSLAAPALLSAAKTAASSTAASPSCSGLCAEELGCIACGAMLAVIRTSAATAGCSATGHAQPALSAVQRVRRGQGVAQRLPVSP